MFIFRVLTPFPICEWCSDMAQQSERKRSKSKGSVPYMIVKIIIIILGHNNKNTVEQQKDQQVKVIPTNRNLPHADKSRSKRFSSDVMKAENKIVNEMKRLFLSLQAAEKKNMCSNTSFPPYVRNIRSFFWKVNIRFLAEYIQQYPYTWLPWLRLYLLIQQHKKTHRKIVASQHPSDWEKCCVWNVYLVFTNNIKIKLIFLGQTCVWTERRAPRFWDSFEMEICAKRRLFIIIITMHNKTFAWFPMPGYASVAEGCGTNKKPFTIVLKVLKFSLLSCPNVVWTVDSPKRTAYTK